MGNIIVKLATKEEQKNQAHQLVKIEYLKKLKVDIDKLHHFHSEHFNRDVLMAFTEDEMELVGTMSVIYPNTKAIYPCESLFGFDLNDRKLVGKNYIEIGRFATKQGENCNRKIVISLFLGAIKHLQNQQIKGWTAIVKDNIFDFLKALSLPMNIINQKPKLSANHPLRTYATDTHLFDVSLADTIPSFQKYDRFKRNGHIKIQL